MNTLPKNWTVEPFSQVARYSVGRTPARANFDYWGTGVVPWVAIADMKQGIVKKTAESISAVAFQKVFRGQVVPAGTLLMSFKLTIGRVATLGIPACHNEAIISIYPREGVNQRYLGYFLSQVDYANHQDRHIKGNTLNKSKIDQIQIILPTFVEQMRIANILDKCRCSINTESIAESRGLELKRAVMNNIFMRGLCCEPQKETEIGRLPESWNVVPLGLLGKIGRGSIPNRSVAAYWNGGRFPWLASAKVYDREIEVADQFITEIALSKCHVPKVQPGAVLMAVTGQGKTLGHCAILKIEASVSAHVAYLQTNTEKVEPSFIRGYLETQYKYLRRVAAGNGSTKAALTCAFLRELLVPLPNKDEQRKMVAILDAFDRKIKLHKQKQVVLETLFESLLHKLMSGAIAVSQLDLAMLSLQSHHDSR